MRRIGLLAALMAGWESSEREIQENKDWNRRSDFLSKKQKEFNDLLDRYGGALYVAYSDGCCDTDIGLQDEINKMERMKPFIIRYGEITGSLLGISDYIEEYDLYHLEKFADIAEQMASIGIDSDDIDSDIYILLKKKYTPAMIIKWFMLLKESMKDDNYAETSKFLQYSWGYDGPIPEVR